MTKPQNPSRRGALIASGMAMMGAAFAGSAEAGWIRKAWTAAEKANVKIVEDFLAAMEASKMDALIASLADDAKVRMSAHQPAAPVNPEGVRKNLGGFLSTGGVKFKILDTIAQGPMVINTRIDRITSKAGVQDLHYMGVFFVKDGKIKEWSDYEVGAATPVKPGQPL